MKPTHNELPPGPVYYLQTGEPPSIDNTEANLFDLWQVVVEAKWLIGAITLLASGFAVVVALMTPPVFRAEVVVVPADADSKGGLMSSLVGQFGGLASLAGIDIGKGGNKSEEVIAVAKSRQFTEAYIKDNNLMPLLFSDKWDSVANQWLPGVKPPTLHDAFAVFSSARSIATDKKTGLITLGFEWKDPKLAADWANDLVVRINQNQKQEAIREAKQSIAYLEKQLDETSVVETRQAIYKLVEAQTQRIMFASVRDQFVFKVIDPAVVPDQKIKPKRNLIAAMGLVGGLVFGVLVAFFRSYIRNQRAMRGSV